MRPSLTPYNPERAAQVRDAAVELFAEKGYRGTTINDIADRLGIRGPSLYKHVASKQQVLREISVSTMDDLLALQAESIAAHDTPTAQLRATAQAIVGYMLTHQARAFVCIRELNALEGAARAEIDERRDLIWQRARAVVDAGIAAGEFALAPASSAVITFCLTELMSAPAAWFVERSVSRDAAVAEITAACLRLVGAQA